MERRTSGVDYALVEDGRAGAVNGGGGDGGDGGGEEEGEERSSH